MQTGAYTRDIPWRVASSFVMGSTAALCRAFLYGFNSVETTGLESFLDLLDKRSQIAQRQRGLLTVSNHVSVLDDPLIWGTLPIKYAFNPDNHRWTLGAHDICFTNRLLSTFFSSGQVLPTHRLKYSSLGGLFQPSVADAIRRLSSIQEDNHKPISHGNLSSLPLPSGPGRSWLHIFPEGCVNREPHINLRYFKWGISRLILESEPAPDFVPMFIDGTQHITNRKWLLPRAGAKVKVVFGPLIDGSSFDDVRSTWRHLVSQSEQLRMGGSAAINKSIHRELNDELKFSANACRLRIEVASRVRDEVSKLRMMSLGHSVEDASLAAAEIWRESQDPNK